LDTTPTPYRNSAIAFVALTALVAAGFWRSYFSQLSEVSFHAHAHGVTMLLWCALLITQALLIRAGHRGIHRILGKVSFILAPAIVVATLSFAHARLEQKGLTPGRLYVLYIQLHLLLLFAVAYGFAIYYRRTPHLHMRFMICTALPLIDPALARIIGNYIWTPPNFAYIQAVTYPVTDLVLVALIASNWRRELGLRSVRSPPPSEFSRRGPSGLEVVRRLVPQAPAVVARRMLFEVRYSNSLQLTQRGVTSFACANAAPPRRAAELSR
jgi:hypothetical protein